MSNMTKVILRPPEVAARILCWSNFPGHLDRWTSPGRGR
jgi:hypothetical protein